VIGCGRVGAMMMPRTVPAAAAVRTIGVVVGFILAVAVYIAPLASSRPSESERVRLWHEAGNTWPPNWQPASAEFQERMKHREWEIMDLPGADERWENWMQFTQVSMISNDCAYM
jgi:hypothetical protein